jgi:hypothetical protein
MGNEYQMRLREMPAAELEKARRHTADHSVAINFGIVRVR